LNQAHEVALKRDPTDDRPSRTCPSHRFFYPTHSDNAFFYTIS
jgi:hypothetical protein